MLVLLIVSLSDKTLGTSQVWFISLSRKPGNKTITLVGLFLIHQREAAKMVQMFSCNGVIHRRRNWSMKLAWWQHKACKRRMQSHTRRAPSLYCSLAVLLKHRRCQAKHFHGAVRVLEYGIAVWEGKHS